MTLPKPPIGAPCNGCGLCCQVRVCGTGSYAMGLSPRGERADGPCPALIAKPDGCFGCGLVERPKDFIKTAEPGRSVTALREAAKLMIGAGMGCDEAGEEPDETAELKLQAIQREFLRRYDEKRIRNAVKTVFGE